MTSRCEVLPASLSTALDRQPEVPRHLASAVPFRYMTPAPQSGSSIRAAVYQTDRGSAAICGWLWGTLKVAIARLCSTEPGFGAKRLNQRPCSKRRGLTSKIEARILGYATCSKYSGLDPAGWQPL